jgi:hypothetical protein
MTKLIEIQEESKKLAPKDRAVLPEWLDESDPETMAVVWERVRKIRAGEATLIDVQQEVRRLVQLFNR